MTVAGAGVARLSLWRKFGCIIKKYCPPLKNLAWVQETGRHQIRVYPACFSKLSIYLQVCMINCLEWMSYWLCCK